MDQTVEPEIAPARIEATLNYVVNNGEKIFTYTGEPGSNDKQTSGTRDPHKVTIRNGRAFSGPFRSRT